MKLLHEKLCPLKSAEKRRELYRNSENTEGAYVNAGGIFKKGTPDEVAIQEEIHTRKGVQRVIEYAFDHAKTTGRSKVCMSDKSNAMTHAGEFVAAMLHGSRGALSGNRPVPPLCRRAGVADGAEPGGAFR